LRNEVAIDDGVIPTDHPTDSDGAVTLTVETHDVVQHVAVVMHLSVLVYRQTDEVLRPIVCTISVQVVTLDLSGHHLAVYDAMLIALYVCVGSRHLPSQTHVTLTADITLWDTAGD